MHYKNVPNAFCATCDGVAVNLHTGHARAAPQVDDGHPLKKS